MKFHKLFILLLGAAQPLAAAEPVNSQLDYFLSLSLAELVLLETSIATASLQSLSKAPAVVSVLTSNDIKATGATNLTDILRAVPGITIRTDPFTNRPLIHFRGAKATQTLLMVNGSPMKDLMWVFGIFWQGLPVSSIDRIEIIRGPGSALFGADASAGVINVITKTAGTIEGSEAGLRLGSFDSRTVWLQHGRDINGFQIGFTAELSGTDGFSPYISSDKQTNDNNDPKKPNSAPSYAPGYAQYGLNAQDLRLSVAKDHWRLLTDYSSHSDMGIGLTGVGVIDPVTRASDSRYNIELLYNNPEYHRDWGLNSRLNYRQLEYSSGPGFQERPPGYTDSNGTYDDGLVNQMRSAEQHVAFEVSGLYKALPDHSIRLGAGYVWEDLYLVDHRVNFGTGPDGNPLPANGPLVDISDTDYAFAPENVRENSYLFIQDIWTINDAWELTSGARYDYYSDFGNSLNPRLALVWQTSPQLTSKLMYGQAFRAPSYQELFAITSRSLPNPELDPERSQTLVLSFSYAASKQLLLGLNLFQYQQSDIIHRIDVVGETIKQYQNTGNHDINGVELEAQWQAQKNINISANYTRRVQDSNHFRDYRLAEQEAYARIDWGFRFGWNWNIQANWIGEREREQKPSETRDSLNGFATLDTTLHYSAANNWTFVASLRNLLDEDALEYSGGALQDDLPLPDRNGYLEVSYKF